MSAMATAGLLALPARRPTVAGRICTPQRFHTKVGRCRVVTAHANMEREEAMKMASSVGLDITEGIFGFNPFAEKWTGRLAMIGFLTSIVEEFLTGRGTLQQLGFETPSVELLVAMCILAFGGTAAATAWTLDRARNGRMTESEIARYRAGLGLTGELQDVAALRAQMKEDGDFLSASDSSAIVAAAREPTAADRFLDMSQEREQAEAEAR